MLKFLIPRLRDILFFSIFTAVILLGPRMLNMDGDLPRHLAIGKYVLDGHFPPTVDIFSHTKTGTPFAPHKWFSGVLFYLAYLLNAEKGIILLSALVLATTFTLIYSDRADKTASILTPLFVTLFGAAVSSLHWIARPHLFTMLLLAIWLILTDKTARGENIKWWVFPLLMLLWNNIHGEYIAGLLVTAAYLAGWAWDFLFGQIKPKVETLKQLGLAFISSLGVTVLNPVSLRAWTTVTSWLSSNYLMEKTQETASPNFLNPQFYILLVFIGFSIFVMAARRGVVPSGQSILLAGFTLMVLNSARNVHIYGVAAPFILAAPFAEITGHPFIKKIETNLRRIELPLRGGIYPITTFLTAALLLNTTALGNMERFSPNYFPIQAVEWLKDNPQKGNMFNPFDWGGYISFTLWPEYKVFVDSQGDVYGEEFLREYDSAMSTADGWKPIFTKYNIEWAILPPNSLPARALSQNPSWELLYGDPTSVIYRKN